MPSLKEKTNPSTKSRLEKRRITITNIAADEELKGNTNPPGSNYGAISSNPFDRDIAANKEHKEIPGNSDAEPERTGWKRYLGILFTISASFNSSFGVLFAKLLHQYNYRGNAASFWRYIGVTVPTLPMLFYYEYMFRSKAKNSTAKSAETLTTVASSASLCSTKIHENEATESVFNGVWPLTEGDNWKTALGVFLTAFFAALAVVLRYYALEYIPIGDTLVISYSTPVLVTVIAHFVLKEKAGIISFVIAFTTLVGVAIVAKPPMLTGSETFTTETLIGTILAVASLVCSTLQYILTRMIRSVHFVFITVAVGVIGLIIALLLMVHFADFTFPVHFNESMYVIGLVATSYFGQMSIILALQFENAGPVSLIRCSDAVIGFVLQFLFLNVIPEWTSVVGGLIVLGGVLVTGLQKYLEGLPDEHGMKRALKFLLV